MGIGTLLRYLVGSRWAILRIAVDRQALPLGALFVLSAALARDYDGEDLVHEPWRLLLPFAASLGTSFLLFCITYLPAFSKGSQKPSFLTGYRMFLGLFWMTAPLAWLYAIPYERFLSATDAVHANLWTLAVVSVWRVLLITRVVNVLMSYRWWQALCLVMALADTEALLALYFLPLPIMNIMGGIRSPEREQILISAAFGLLQGTCCSLLVWYIGASAAIERCKPDWVFTQQAEAQPRAKARWLWGLALCAIVIWIFILPFTQPEQMLRREVESDLRNGRIAEALAELLGHRQSDFPPHWDPPPRSITGDSMTLFEPVLRGLVESPTAPWFRSLYLDKVEENLAGIRYGMHSEETKRLVRLWILAMLKDNAAGATAELTRVAHLLEKCPEDLILLFSEDAFSDHYIILLAAVEEAGDSARPVLANYLKAPSPARCSCACEVARKTNQAWLAEFLIPMLDDNREVDSYRLVHPTKKGGESEKMPARVCDIAARALSSINPGLSFEMVGTPEELDKQIQRIKERLSKKTP